jgi:hypothetical protein
MRWIHGVKPQQTMGFLNRFMATPINRFFEGIDSRQTKIFRYFSRSFIGNGGVAERSNAADCKSALYEFDGSNPSPTTILTNPFKTAVLLGVFNVYSQ